MSSLNIVLISEAKNYFDKEKKFQLPVKMFVQVVGPNDGKKISFWSSSGPFKTITETLIEEAKEIVGIYQK